jgi:hypothetical protein
MKQKPTVGDIVHFHFGDQRGTCPNAAVVTWVGVDGRVELEVFGLSFDRFQGAVRHRDDPERRAEDDFWDWPRRG